MGLSLYARVRDSARYYRNPMVRSRINVFLRVLKEGEVRPIRGRSWFDRLTILSLSKDKDRPYN